MMWLDAERVMKVLKSTADDSMREMLEREMVIGRALYEGLGEVDKNGEWPAYFFFTGLYNLSKVSFLNPRSCLLHQETLPFMATCLSRRPSERRQRAESFSVRPFLPFIVTCRRGNYNLATALPPQ